MIYVCVVVVDDDGDVEIERDGLIFYYLRFLFFSPTTLFSSWKPSMTMPMRILHVP